MMSKGVYQCLLEDAFVWQLLAWWGSRGMKPMTTAMGTGLEGDTCIETVFLGSLFIPQNSADFNMVPKSTLKTIL